MHIASLVKRPCYLLKLSSRNENMGESRTDKIWRNLPICNSKSDLLNVNIYSNFKIPCYLLKLSSGNEIMGVSRADNSVKIWHNLPISNPKPDIHNINAHTKFGENPLMYTRYHPETKTGRTNDWRTDRHTDVQRETIIPRHYFVAGYKKWQKIRQGLYEKHMHIFRLWRKHVQSSKKISINCMRSYAHEIPTVYILWKND